MNYNEEIAALRREYSMSELLESEVPDNPFDQFHKWFREAIRAEVPEPNAMCLSTIDGNRPDARIVLLKGIEHGGFVFYTNYNSSKGRQIAANPNVHLNFVWFELERQVRIYGVAHQVEASESDAYYHSRPFESRVGAWVSKQSEILNSRDELLDQMQHSLKVMENSEISRPEHWGGYCVVPSYFEFWQGRPGRLHDRLCYKQQGERWELKRLYP